MEHVAILERAEVENNAFQCWINPATLEKAAFFGFGKPKGREPIQWLEKGAVLAYRFDKVPFEKLDGEQFVHVFEGNPLGEKPEAYFYKVNRNLTLELIEKWKAWRFSKDNEVPSYNEGEEQEYHLARKLTFNLKIGAKITCWEFSHALTEGFKTFNGECVHVLNLPPRLIVPKYIRDNSPEYYEVVEFKKESTLWETLDKLRLVY